MATVAITETYSDVVLLIGHTVSRFQRRYGGSYADLMSEACLAYMKAYHSHDEEIADFTTWLYHCVWNRLRNNHFKKKEKHVAITFPIPAKPKFSSRSFLMDLSDDAREVVSLALEQPLEIRHILRERNSKDIPASVRAAIKTHLREQGWSWERIKATFAEIREALQ